MGTDAVLSGASQRADAHHRRFSRSPRLASLILSPSLPLRCLNHHLVISIQQQPSRETDHQPHPIGCSDTRVASVFACRRRNPLAPLSRFLPPRVRGRVLPLFFFLSFLIIHLSVSLFLSILSLFLCFIFPFLLSITFPWNLFSPLKSTFKILSFYYVSRHCDSYLSCRNSERTSRKCALETAFGGRVILHGDYQ